MSRIGSQHLVGQLSLPQMEGVAEEVPGLPDRWGSYGWPVPHGLKNQRYGEHVVVL